VPIYSQRVSQYSNGIMLLLVTISYLHNDKGSWTKETYIQNVAEYIH